MLSARFTAEISFRSFCWEKHMEPDPRVDSILSWHYRRLAEEAQSFAHSLKDPSKRRIFEEIASRYRRLAAGQVAPIPAMPKSAA